MKVYVLRAKESTNWVGQQVETNRNIGVYTNLDLAYTALEETLAMYNSSRSDYEIDDFVLVDS